MHLSDYSNYYVIIGTKPQDYYKDIRTDAKILECIRAEDNLFEGHAKYYRYHDRSDRLHIEITDVVKSLSIQFQDICDDNDSYDNYNYNYDNKNKESEPNIELTDAKIEKESLICINDYGTGNFEVGELGVLEHSGAKLSSYYYKNTKNHILVLPIELYEKYKVIQNTAANCPLARDLLISHIIELEKRLINIQHAVTGGFQKFIDDNEFDCDEYALGELFGRIYGNPLPKNVIVPNIGDEDNADEAKE